MPLDRSKIHKILVISLSNIGDVVLTLPVMDALKEAFPGAKLSIVIGPKTVSLFQNNPNFEQIHIYNKKQPPLKTIKWVWKLRQERFDLCVDLRNTAIPYLISPRHRTSCFFKKRENEHMREKHLRRIKNFVSGVGEREGSSVFYIPYEDSHHVRKLLDAEMSSSAPIAVVAPGAADYRKRWHEDGFCQLADHAVKRYGFQIAFVGDTADQPIAEKISSKMSEPSMDFCGRLSLLQLAALLNEAAVAVVNDSAPMHLASYLNRPTFAFFGPSDPVKYGPWSEKRMFLKKDATPYIKKNPQGEEEPDHMKAISSEEAIRAFDTFMKGIA